MPPNIGRRRTQHEPREAAWDTSPCYTAIRDDDECFQRGCKAVKREQFAESEALEGLSGSETPEAFEDFIPCGVDGEGSEVSPESYATAHFPDSAEGVIEEIREDMDNRQFDAYLEWYKFKTGSAGILKESSMDSDAFYEHVARTHCIASSGYNGNAISAEEMRYCNAVQYFSRYDIDHYHGRSRDWPPELDDEDFEREGKYHLTGLGDGCAIYEDDCSFTPNAMDATK